MGKWKRDLKTKTWRRKKKRRGGNINRGLKTSLMAAGVSQITPLSKTLKVTCKYQENTNLNPSLAGGIALNSYSANGMYDPNVSGIGHQPRSFDQLMTLYDHYVVIASSIQVTFFNYDQSNPQVVGIGVADQSTSYGILNNALESPDCVYGVLGVKGSGNDIVTLRRSISPPKWLGSGIAPLSNDQLQGSSSTNPPEDVLFQVFAGAFDEATDTNDVGAQVVINYTAILKEPRNPAQS